MLMLKTTHDRIVADDAKKLGEQAQLIVKLTAARHEMKQRAEKVFAANLKLAAECDKLRARLAPFITPRERDCKGRFQPVKSTIDQMIDALEAM